MQHLAPFIVMLALLIIIAVIIIALLNHRLKKTIIESSDIDNKLLETLTGPGLKKESLKWGLILFFGGIGLIIIEFLPYDSSSSPLPYGVEAVFLSAGFLCYYLLVHHKKS